MKTIRASEVGTYLYCHHAWWLQQQGVQSENLAELASGQEIHAWHNRAVVTSGCLRILAYGLLLAALILLVAYGIQRLF